INNYIYPHNYIVGMINIFRNRIRIRSIVTNRRILLRNIKKKERGCYCGGVEPFSSSSSASPARQVNGAVIPNAVVAEEPAVPPLSALVLCSVPTSETLLSVHVSGLQLFTPT